MRNKVTTVPDADSGDRGHPKRGEGGEGKAGKIRGKIRRYLHQRTREWEEVFSGCEEEERVKLWGDGGGGCGKGNILMVRRDTSWGHN